jgi:hypothetical protein
MGTATRVLKRRRSGVGPHVRMVVPAVLLALALAVQYRLSTLPVATDVTGPLTVKAGTELILFGAAGDGALFAYSGRANESADIRFDRARLAPETIALLLSVGIEPGDAPGPISWIAAARSAGRTFVEARAAKGAEPLAELRLRAPAAVGSGHRELELTTRGAPLQVLIASPYVAGQAGAQSPKILNVGVRRFELPGAIPLRVLVEDGAGWRMRFSQPADLGPTQFTLGSLPIQAADAGGLGVRAVGISEIAGARSSFAFFACAAPAGAVLRAGAASLARGSCDAAGLELRARRLRVESGALELDLAGSAWAQRRSESLGGDLLGRVIDNPVLAGVLLALNLSFVAWLLFEVFAARMRRVRAPWQGGVFLSYRREDSAAQAGRLYDHLSARFGADRVFIDVDALLPGDDFARRIRETLEEADVLLAIIGRGWLDVRDELGARRLDDARDFVRIEIVAALERGLRVIPVLVGNARMPKPEELPPVLADLGRRNAVVLSDAQFASDVQRLVLALEQGPQADSHEPLAVTPTQERSAHSPPVTIAGGEGRFDVQRR